MVLVDGKTNIILKFIHRKELTSTKDHIYLHKKIDGWGVLDLRGLVPYMDEFCFGVFHFVIFY